MNDEPQIHSHYEDSLPEGHKWANKTLYCPACGKMVHAFNNECMITWVEWFDHFSCLECFIVSQRDVSVLEDELFKMYVGDCSDYVK